MNEEAEAPSLVQEYVDSAGAKLRVDTGRGVLRGVKLLGLQSRNGRRYAEGALSKAVGLYEGSKVNVNHPMRDPLSPRDYRDRLGVVRNVRMAPGEGLFGDLHYNPKHALAEQLAWDAKHAPENVGLSHNVLARTRADGDGLVVEAISRVQSVDLVADPATTRGLFEQDERYDQRPDAHDQLALLREEIDRLDRRVFRQERLLRFTAATGVGVTSSAIGEQELKELLEADEAGFEALLERRLQWGKRKRDHETPCSREQASYSPRAGAPCDARSFVAAITDR